MDQERMGANARSTVGTATDASTPADLVAARSTLTGVHLAACVGT